MTDIDAEETSLEGARVDELIDKLACYAAGAELAQAECIALKSHSLWAGAFCSDVQWGVGSCYCLSCSAL